MYIYIFVFMFTGSKGTGKEALIQKVISTRPNVISMDIGHLMDRTDDEFVKELLDK